VKQAKKDAEETGASFYFTNDPAEAADSADAVYTDVWASMGQEKEKEKRAKIFTSFQVNRKLMAKANSDAVFMHCLPAHRGEEVTDEVIDSAQSVVFDQAENRLHVQKIIMLLLMEKRKK
jgi:ornithine carbamoyltransferase